MRSADFEAIDAAFATYAAADAISDAAQARARVAKRAADAAFATYAAVRAAAAVKERVRHAAH
jgi:hypothetical protein